MNLPNQQRKPNNSPQEIKALLEKSNNPVCFLDSRIDYDSLCAPTALNNILKKYFNKTLTLNFEKTIPSYWFTKLSDFFTISNINTNVPLQTYDFSKHDLIVFLDTGNIGHISDTESFTPPANIPVLDIDHHYGNVGYGKYNYVKPYGSACAVLAELFFEWGVEIDRETANTLITAMITDNGYFQYNTTVSEDFDYISKLFKLTSDYYKIVHTLTFNDSLADFKLQKIVFDNFTYLPQYKTAYTLVLKKDLAENGIDIKDSFVTPSDLIKKLSGTNFVFVVKEAEEEGFFDISLRSHNENFNCVLLARDLSSNGGGHRMAAGANIKAETPQEAIDIVINTSKNPKYLENS